MVKIQEKFMRSYWFLGFAWSSMTYGGIEKEKFFYDACIYLLNNANLFKSQQFNETWNKIKYRETLKVPPALLLISVCISEAFMRHMAVLF